MNLKDFLLDDDDAGDWSAAERLEQHRQQFEGLMKVMAAQRAELEAKGMDVDAALAELAATWARYEQCQHEVEQKEEDFLQRTADVADAREQMLQLLRDGIAGWTEALETAPAGSTQRVEVWEGFTAWKAQMRTVVESRLTAKQDPDERATYRAALRILED